MWLFTVQNFWIRSYDEALPLHVLWVRSNKPQLLPITSSYLAAVQLFMMVMMTKRQKYHQYDHQLEHMLAMRSHKIRYPDDLCFIGSTSFWISTFLTSCCRNQFLAIKMLHSTFYKMVHSFRPWPKQFWPSYPDGTNYHSNSHCHN